SFASKRKLGIAQLYKNLVEFEYPNPEERAQQVELEVTKKAIKGSTSGATYHMSLTHKIAQIRRESTSGIMPVNKNGERRIDWGRNEEVGLT
uniref:Uncharacterized protein n=1 Tax=Caenorhabditis japonica TaxID=281687 RepID=A0A8R1ELN8_CAEJA